MEKLILQNQRLNYFHEDKKDWFLSCVFRFVTFCGSRPDGLCSRTKLSVIVLRMWVEQDLNSNGREVGLVMFL